VSRLRGLFTEIRLDAFLSAKHFKFIGIVNQWLGDAGCHRNTTGPFLFCETIQVHWYWESVTRLRLLITEIRQVAFLSVKTFKWISGNVTQVNRRNRLESFHSANPRSSFVLWISGKVTRVHHKNTTGRLPFCETLPVRWYFESVSRLRRLITEIRQDAFLYAKPFKFIVIVNQWLGDACWSQKYDSKPFLLRNPWSLLVFRFCG
jgi:hypothetical protein